MRLIAATILMLLICPAVSFADQGPFVLIDYSMDWSNLPVTPGSDPSLGGLSNGVIIRSECDGPVWVVTAAHSLRMTSTIRVWISDRWHPAEVLGHDARHDVMLLKVPGRFRADWIRVFPGEVPIGEQLTWCGYFPPTYQYRCIPGRRVRQTRYRWYLLAFQGRPGMSGGGFVYQGQLAGILSGTTGTNQQSDVVPSTLLIPLINQWMATDSEPTRTLDSNVLYAVTSPGCIPCEQFKSEATAVTSLGIQLEYLQQSDPRLQGRSVSLVPTFFYRGNVVTGYQGMSQLLQQLGISAAAAKVPDPIDPPNNEAVPAVGGSPEPPLERQATPDAPGPQPAGGASGTLQPPSQDATAPQDAGTEAPLSFPDLAKSWAWDRLSGWGWAAVGAGLFGSGSLAAWAVPVIGRRIVRSVTQSGGDPVSPPAGGGGVDLRGGHAVPPPRNTDVGRERIVERVIDLSADERRKYEQQIADLRSQSPTVEYREIVSDVGLGRMRQAMDLTAKKYPSSARWVQLIEQVYNKILSGEKLNA